MRQPARSDEVWIYHKVMQMYKDVRGGRDVGFLQSRNCAAPLQFWNYNKFWTRANAVRPYRFVAVILWLCTIFIQFSSFKQGAGSAFLCDQNLSSCSPNSRWQNVSSYTATLQDIRFGIIPLYLSRKRGALLHKKCNNCRNVAKLKYKSFVCTNQVLTFCAMWRWNVMWFCGKTNYPK